MCLVRVACIIKSGPTDHFKRERATHNVYRPNNVMLMGHCSLQLNGHKVRYLPNTINREKACNNDIRLWNVYLFMPHPWRLWRLNTKEPPFLSVEYPSKNTWGIKTRDTTPVN